MAAAFKEAGYKTYTIDINEQFKPDLAMDIMQFTPAHLPQELATPTVIWFSPPCTTFSVMTIGRHFKNGRPKSSACFVGLALAYRCIELIKELKPKYWFIENPMGMLRKQEFMQELPRKTVTYCQYGAKYQKKTDIWTNASHWVPKKQCNTSDKCHISSPRGSRTGIQDSNKDAYERAKIPIELCKEIVKVCEENIKEKQNCLI